MSTLIENGHVVTMNAEREVFDGGYVVVGDDGRIAAVGPASTVPDGTFDERLDAALGEGVVDGRARAAHGPPEATLDLARSRPAGKHNHGRACRGQAAFHPAHGGSAISDGRKHAPAAQVKCPATTVSEAAT